VARQYRGAMATSPGGSTVSVVVCTFQRRQLIDRTLRALAAQDLDHDRMQVVVVDNGATDGTGDLLEGWRATAPWAFDVVSIARNGRVGTARNLGVAKSTGDVVAFTDDDCRPVAGWLSALVGAIDVGADIVQGKTVPDPGQPLERLSRSQWVLQEDGLFETCNIAYRRAVLDAFGEPPFRSVIQDELLAMLGPGLGTTPFGEDVDLGWRAVRAGASVVFAPDAVVHHEVRPPDLRTTVQRSAIAAGFPLLTRQVPELRDRLYHRRWFLARTRPTAWALIAGIVLTASGRAPRLGLLLGAVWGAARLQPVQPRELLPRIRHELPHLAVRDLAETAALVYGSARARTPVL
jgi:glycosyltransferase involved in cell wall biosynthesis